MPTVQDKERILKAEREKCQVTDKGKSIRTKETSSKTLKDRKA
jgi:hypothetical protein